MPVWLTPGALSSSNQILSFWIWVPAFAGMSGVWVSILVQRHRDR
jgi:hypothetical protein